MIRRAGVKTKKDEETLDLEASIISNIKSLSQYLDLLKSPAGQEVKKKEHAEAQARASAEASSKKSVANKKATSTPKAVIPKKSAGRSYMDTSISRDINVSDSGGNVITNAYAERGVSDTQFFDISGDEIAASFGTDDSDIKVSTFDSPSKNLETGDEVSGEISAILVKDGQNGKIAVPSNVTGSGAKTHLPLFRMAIGAAISDNSRDHLIDFEGSVFRKSEFVEWAEANGVELLSEYDKNSLSKSDIIKFLDSIKKDDAGGDSSFDESSSGERERLISASKDKDEFGKSRISRSSAMAVNYSAEAAIFNEEGRAKGTGEISKSYLDNSDPSLTHAGHKISLSVYTGDVDVYVYDQKTGRVILDENSSKTKARTNADEIVQRNASNGGQRIGLPIAIRLVNDDGSTGRIIGFLPDNQWLDERIDGSRINIKFNPKTQTADDIEAEIEAVKEIRERIESEFSSNRSFSIDATISNVDEGKLFYGTTPLSVAEGMPEVINDTKSKYGISPFGFVASGVIIGTNGLPVNGVSNLDYISESHDGMPVVIVPSSNGRMIAAKAVSKTLSEVPWGISSIVGGTRSFIEGSSGLSEFNGHVSGERKINSVDSFREYLKQFIFFDSHAKIEGYPAGKKYFYIYTDAKDPQSTNTYIVFGRKGSSNTRMLIQSSSKSVSVNEQQLKSLAEFLKDVKHTYMIDDATNDSKKSSIVAISEDGKSARVIAKSKEVLFTKTLNTFAKSAGKSNAGNNIYTIQPVIQFELPKESSERDTGSEEITEQSSDMEKVNSTQEKKPDAPPIRGRRAVVPPPGTISSSSVDEAMAAEGISGVEMRSEISNYMQEQGQEATRSPLHKTDISDFENTSKIISKFCKG